MVSMVVVVVQKPNGEGAADADLDTEMNDGMTDINDAMTENIDSVSGIGSKNDSDSQAKQSTAGGDDDDEEAGKYLADRDKKKMKEGTNRTNQSKLQDNMLL